MARFVDYVLDPGELDGEKPGNLNLALKSGRLVATVVSARSGKHISVQLQAKIKEGKRFRACELYRAERVYADVPREGGATGTEIGVVHLVGRWAGHIMPPWESEFDQARLWAMRRVLDVAQGRAPLADDQATIMEGQTCLMCGRELTDPESIARNIGPTCWEVATSSQHQHRGDGAMPTGYQASDLDELMAAVGPDLSALGSEVRREASTREEIEAELQQTVAPPAGDGVPEPLGEPDDVGPLIALGAGDDAREVLATYEGDRSPSTYAEEN